MSSTRVLSAAIIMIAAVAAAPRGASADTSWRVRGETAAGADSNALRIVGTGTSPAAPFTGGALWAEAQASDEAWALAARLAEGARLFGGEPAASLLASRLDLRARRALSPSVSVGATAMARDLRERGGVRDQHELQGLGTVELARARWRVEGFAGWMLSAPRAAGLTVFRREGPEVGATAALRVARELSLGVTYGYDAWRYPAWPGARRDRTHVATLEWTWNGPILASVGYSLGDNRSNVDGGAWRRQRVTARLALDLPYGFDLASRVALQRSRYPSGVILSEQLYVREGDEAQNAFETQLARAVSRRVELAFRLAHYRSEVGADPAYAFRRTVAQIVMAFTTGG